MLNRNTILMLAVVWSTLILTTATSQTRKRAPQNHQGPTAVQTTQPLPEAQRPQEDMRAEPINIHPLPDENLNTYKARMDAFFAPQLRSLGREALIREEGSKYNQYQAFLHYWEPRLFALRGDFKAYFELERNFYRNRRPAAAAGNRPAAQPEARFKSAATVLSTNKPWQEVGNISKPSSNVGAEGTGPTKFITFYNPSPSRMLCASMLGGLFYSKNGGVTWSPTGTDTEVGRSGVSAAVFHPNDYKTWFASSSGNGDFEPMWIGYTGGIFRTSDEGVTWSMIADQTQLGGIWTKIYQLEINPANPDQLWAATSAGLFTTTNGTAASPTWTATPSLSGKLVYDFAIRPSNVAWLYATVADWNNGANINWRYMYSNDNGSTWQNIPGQSSLTAGASRLTIEVTPAKAVNLYCLTTFSGGSSKLYIHDWGANLWSIVYGSANMISGHAFGVDPANWREIFLSESTEARRYTHQGVPLFIDSHSTYHAGGTFHPDIEDLVPHPTNPNEVWMCNHGGVSVSFDNGQTWTDRSTGLGVAQSLRMAAAADPSYVALGLYHDGSIVTTSQWTPLWSPAWKQFPSAFCDGMRPMIDPATPQYMWHSCQWGQWFRSTDFGVTFSNNGPTSPGWIVEAAFNRLDSKTQFRITLDNSSSHTVKRTTDRGNTWAQIADFKVLYPLATRDYILWKVYTPETNGDYLIAHLLEKPKNANVNWTNHLYRTKIANDSSPANVIASWQELPLPVDMWMGDVDFDPANPNIIYMANSSSSVFNPSLTGTGMVYKVDYTNPAAHTYNVCTPGLCWDFTQNLPNTTMGQDDLAVERGSNGRLYVATDFGVYYSDNASRSLGGNGWTQLGTGLPHTGYNGLEINYTNNKIRAASFGRGVWEADLQTECIEPPSGLALWLPLDEASGPTALNAGRPVFQGTHVGAPTPQAAGEVDGALCFNGQNYVDVPSYGAINFASLNFSLDLWVRRNPGASGTESLIDKREMNSAFQIRGYHLFLFSGQIGLQLADGTFANYLSQPTVPADGLWHHIAVTVNRSNSAGGRFYLDGQPVGPTFNPTNHPGSLNSVAPFRVGTRSFLGASTAISGGLNGCLDEVQAFRRALSADEVLAIYRAGHQGKCKQKSVMPSVSSYCTTGNTLTVAAQVCNFRPQVHSFNYSFQGLPAQAGCSIAGPTTFSPASGTITVAPGQCQLVQTNITKPAGLTGSGSTACYRIVVQTLATQEIFSSGGMLDTWSTCNPGPSN